MSFFNNITWSPREYADAAVVAKEASAGILARLEWMTLQPRLILDVGCGAGETSIALQNRYPDAQVCGVDFSQAMLQAAKEKGVQVQQANAEQLPFANDSVDIIVANLLLPWHNHPAILIKEWRRVLRENGVLMFTALGPDTLKEWRHVFKNEEIPFFVDMHDFGDLLLQEGFAEPVLDVEHYTISYRERKQLLQELQVTGVWFPEDSNLTSALEAQATNEVTYEIIFAHAFAPVKTQEVSASEDGMIRIPLAHLRQQLREKK